MLKTSFHYFLLFRHPTRYRLDGSGIEFPCGRDFPHPSRPAPGPTQPHVQWIPGLFPGAKRPDRGVNHPLPSCFEVKERVALYLYSLCRLSLPVLGRNFIPALPRSRTCVISCVVFLSGERRLVESSQSF